MQLKASNGFELQFPFLTLAWALTSIHLAF
jgi:hypothetical protein